ncbi:MAG TPA: hypothetical protein PLK86_03670, partial [Bacilli bacterium]|nr:hypothetical protein [Bacilli bacterium]
KGIVPKLLSGLTVFLILICGCQTNRLTPGEELFNQAENLEQQKSFSLAKVKYLEALGVL